MRKFKFLFLLACVLTIGLFLWREDSEWVHGLKQYVENDEVVTLEAHFTPEEIIQTQVKKLLTDNKHTLQEPTLRFYPYLLMDVKFTNADKKTKEGILLWGMDDGEIVLNTETWETTHGYTDCIEAGANRNDFKLIHALETSGGSGSRDKLLEKMHVEPEIFDNWVASALQKHLIVQQGSTYYLHIQNPKVCIQPQTKISQPLVSKRYSHAFKVAKRFSKSEIERSANATFGSDFTVRSTKEIFLPVYSIDIANPDGSVLTTYWNSLNGQRIYPRY